MLRTHPLPYAAAALTVLLFGGLPGGTASAEPSEPAAPAFDPLAGPRGLAPDALVRGEEAAYQSFMRGTRAFEANDFDRALTEFGDALRALPDEAPYARSRGSVALWIAQCHAMLYGLRADVAALDAEQTVLAAYAARLDAIAVDPTDRAAKARLAEGRLGEIQAERARVSADHGDVDTQLGRSLQGEYGGVAASAWAPRVDDLAWHRRRDDPRPRGRQSHDVDPQAAARTEGRSRRPGTGLVAGGAVALGVGVGALAVMAAGLARARAADAFTATQSPDDRRAQIGRGHTGNAMAVAGAVTGGVSVLTGAVLVGIGVTRRRAAGTRAAIVPSASRRGAGLHFVTRF